MTRRSPFKYFKTSPEIIRLAVMLYVRFPLSLRNVEVLLHERGVEVIRGRPNRGPLCGPNRRSVGCRQGPLCSVRGGGVKHYVLEPDVLCGYDVP
jgi:hypothetical protein